MRICATADLHFNHARSKELAIEVIAQINRAEFDLLLLIGDTATGEGDDLERCLAEVKFAGPKLFVAGNHELWSRSGDTHDFFSHILPQRIRVAGWHWLEGDPYQLGSCAIVGTIGWYDYSFAPTHLGIPERFYQAKISPGAAARLSEHEHLVAGQDDVLEHHLEVVARWNDGKFVRLNRPDPQFLQERLTELQGALDKVASAQRVIAAVHHLPFSEMLPPRRNASWDFAWAYLGSSRLGEMLLAQPRISHVLCGHTHMPDDRQIGHLRVINIGAGYRQKRFVMLDV